MGLLTKAFEKRSQLLNPEPWLLKALGYRPTHSGTNVTEQTALTFSAVFSCVSVLARTMAAMPIKTYERLETGGKRVARQHPLYKLLRSAPNPEITASTFKSTAMAHLALWGNAYAEIEFNRVGEPRALWLIPPWKVEPRRTQKMVLYYEIRTDQGETRTLLPSQVLHIPGLGIDGVKGLSPVALHRQGIGLGLAAQEFGARFFGQGTNLGGFIEIPGKMKDATVENLRKDINDKYGGLGKSHRLLFLEEGMKYHQAGMPMTDAQFLESRKWEVNEVARIYNVPLHLIQEHEKSTSWGTGIEQMNLGFVVHTMTPYMVNWEQEIERKLHFGNDDYFSEFLVEGLLRGDSQARAEYYNKMFNVGGFSPNEILEKENMNPIGPEGDERFVPLNMVPLKRAIEDNHEPKAKAPSKPDESKGAESGIEKRSGKTRHRIAKSYQRIFEDVGKRIVRREEWEVMGKAKELLASRDKNTLLEWLEQFYKKHPEYIKKQMLPAVTSLAEAIQAEVAGEVDIEAGMTPELKKFTREYVDVFAARHVSSSQGQLAQVIQEAYDAGSDELEALQARFDEWGDRRPGKIAGRETVQINGAVFRFVAAAAGITKLIWRNTGSKSCPFCQQLDGRVVGIEQPFIPANDFIEADDGSGMKVYGKKMHPPIHDGCVCVVEAE